MCGRRGRVLEMWLRRKDGRIWGRRWRAGRRWREPRGGAHLRGSWASRIRRGGGISVVPHHGNGRGGGGGVGLWAVVDGARSCRNRPGLTGEGRGTGGRARAQRRHGGHTSPPPLPSNGTEQVNGTRGRKGQRPCEAFFVCPPMLCLINC